MMKTPSMKMRDKISRNRKKFFHFSAVYFNIFCTTTLQLVIISMITQPFLVHCTLVFEQIIYHVIFLGCY